MYQFTQDCMIGIDEIDEEHRQLFQMLNEAITLVGNGGNTSSIAKNLLQKLKDYAGTHFAHEESYMERIDDPELPRQKKEHEQFVQKVESYRIEDWTDEQSAQNVNDLLVYMVKWLYHHILGSDIMIGKLKKKEPEDIFAFTDKYKTGIELIDHEHRRLFEIIRETNEVIHAQFLHDKYDEIINIINQLRDYTIMHFQDEEKYMERIGYENLEFQRFAHMAFVDRLNEINLDDVDDNQKEYLDELLQFLLSWLTNHILKMDKQIPVMDVDISEETAEKQA